MDRALRVKLYELGVLPFCCSADVPLCLWKKEEGERGERREEKGKSLTEKRKPREEARLCQYLHEFLASPLL